MRSRGTNERDDDVSASAEKEEHPAGDECRARKGLSSAMKLYVGKEGEGERSRRKGGEPCSSGGKILCLE